MPSAHFSLHLLLEVHHAWLCRNSSLLCLTIDGIKSLLACHGKHTVVLHVLGVPLCQKWTGRHRAVPLVMGRGPDCRLFQREGEGGSCFQLTVSFSSFLALTPLFLCLNCFHHCLCFCALCFTFSSAASVVSGFFDQCVLYCVNSFTLIT